jgi:GGDEF domain-containing protein
VSDYHPESRARPVADVPVAALLARADELARRWAIALILARPLERIGEVPLEEIAREAPAIFEQLIRALTSDAALEHLFGSDPGGAPGGGLVRRLAPLAGAQDAAAAVSAIEALRSVLWDATVAELRDPHPRQVGDLADRLASVCSAVAMALLAAGSQTQAGSASAGDEPRVERREAPGRGASGRATPTPEPDPWEVHRRAADPQDTNRSETITPEAGPTSPWAEQPRIEIRDVRGEGPSAWIGSIGRRLERHQEDALPFGVLLVEVLDIERLVQAGAPEEVSKLIGKVESALSEELRPADLLTRESEGRYWLVTPETDGVGVRMLAERLARGVRSSASDHGTPLEVAIGIAVCPDDGLDAATLAAHADAGVFAARAAGRSIAPVDEA